MRLIDANATLLAIDIHGTNKFGMLDEDIREFIKKQPTVDAVEVVRCQDCKHRCNGRDCTHPLLLSYSWGAIRNVKDNDFCSYGKRREG